MESMAQRLKRFRSTKGLSIPKAAELIKVSESTYRDWESGRAIRGEPHVRIAEVFGVSLYDLLADGEVEAKSLYGYLDQIKELVERIRLEC